jgi:hypothetical protein
MMSRSTLHFITIHNYAYMQWTGTVCVFVCVCECMCVSCTCVCVLSGPLLYMVQTMILKDFSRFAVLVVCVMLPFCGGLSHRFETQTNFQTFGETCGAFLKMFVDPGSSPLICILLESIFLLQRC